MGFKVLLVSLPYALLMLFSVTLADLQQVLSVLYPVTLLALQPLGLMRCRVDRLPPGSWARSAGWPFVIIIITFVVLDGGSAGAQLSLG